MGYFRREADEELHLLQRQDLLVWRKDYFLVAVDEEARHQVPVHSLELMALLALLEQVEPREDVASRKQAQ